MINLKDCIKMLQYTSTDWEWTPNFLHNAERCFLHQPTLKVKLGNQKKKKKNQPYINADQTIVHYQGWLKLLNKPRGECKMSSSKCELILRTENIIMTW